MSVLDADPELAAAIPADELVLARRKSVVQLEHIAAGRWSYPTPKKPGGFGLLLTSGLVGARVGVGEHAHIELLGEGDVVHPWVGFGPEESVPAEVDWRAFEATTVAVLDEGFARAVAGWPEIPAALMYRLVMRARRLSLQFALSGLSRIDERLLAALWHFADRWGHVTPTGVTVRLALTQAQLGEVICAARPSVSTAANELQRRGAVAFDRTRRIWTLHGDPPAVLDELTRQVGLAVG